MLRTDYGIPFGDIVTYCKLLGIYDIDRFAFLVRAVESATRENKKTATRSE